MTTTVLGPNSAGFTHKVTLAYSDFTAAAGAADATASVAILTVPVGTVCFKCAMALTTGFVSADSHVNKCTLAIGHAGGTTNLYLATTELLEALTEIHYMAANTCYAYITADTIDAQIDIGVSSGSPLVDELSAGVVEVYLAVADLTKLTGA